MKKFLPQALTLTLYNREATEYGVCFMTSEDVACRVEFTDTRDRSFKRAEVTETERTEYKGMFRHSVVCALEGGKSYLWRVTDGERHTDTFKMNTVDPRCRELSFAVFSDTQDRLHLGKWWKTAWRDALTRFPEIKICLHGGDIVDNGAKHTMWEKVTSHNRGLFTSVPMLPVTGNHDHVTEKDGVLHPYFNIQSPADKEEALIYYSFDAGEVHFTMLSSGDYDYTERHGLKEAQIEWAKRDLTSTDKKWKVVLIHTPLYSPGKYGSHPRNSSQPEALRRQLNGIFAETGVDIVFCGHDHIFSETYPILRDGRADHASPYVIKKLNGQYYRLAVSPAGPIHVESGCAGNQDRMIECGDGMDEVSAGYFRDIVETPKGCVSYVAVRVKDNILSVDYVLKRVKDGADVTVRRFGIIK